MEFFEEIKIFKKQKTFLKLYAKQLFYLKENLPYSKRNAEGEKFRVFINQNSNFVKMLIGKTT